MSTLRRANAGFTLLEILVAFAIAVTALGLLFRIQASSTATVLLSGEYLAATELAQSLIVELSATERTLVFAKHGTSAGKYSWSARAEPYDAEHAGEGAPFPLRALTVEVAWAARDKERRIVLHTVKPFVGPAS